MTLNEKRSGFVTIADGVRLRYTQSGPASGKELLFIPGWSQTAAQFQKQVAHFESEYHVTTYDHRGHGESDKPSFGYRVSRLAADLDALITQLDLRSVTVIGHSMGSSTVWAYWDLFADARNRLQRLVLVDQAPAMTINPAWTKEYAAGVSAILETASAFGIANAMQSNTKEGMEAGLALLRGMFTPALTEEDFQWMVGENLKMSRQSAGELIIHHASDDWSDVLPRITIPTLVVAAEASLFPAKGIERVASLIPGAKLRTFSKEEQGSHFMFWQNPELFNKIVSEFLQDS